MKSKQKTAQLGQALPMEANDLSNAYLINGNALYALSSQHRYSTPPIEKKFRSTKELEQLVLHNYKTLFGEKTILVSLTKKSDNFFKNALLPDNLLLDLEATPKLYFLDTVPPKENFLKDIFPRITQYFLFLIDERNIKELAQLICKEAKKELAVMQNDKDLLEVVTRIITFNASVLLLSEAFLPQLDGIKQLYPQPWSQVRSVVVKRFTSNGDTLISITPSFSELQQQHQNPKAKREKVLVTEEFHFEGVAEAVKAAYLEIKEGLLKIDGQLQFNPQTYYIALKKDRNIAFFHFRKNKIDLVIKYPEKNVRKLLKYHEVRTLKESIQKFWGGESVSVGVSGPEHLQELIGLLKKVVERR